MGALIFDAHMTNPKGGAAGASNMVIIDVSGSMVVPDVRGRGVMVALTVTMIEFAFLGGLVTSLLGLTVVPPFSWLAAAVLYPVLIGWVVRRRFRALTQAAVAFAPTDQECAVLFSGAVVGTQVRVDGVIVEGTVLGEGWLSVEQSVLRIYERAQTPELKLEVTASELIAVDIVRLWRGILTNPLMRVRMSDGRAVDMVPCAAGLDGMFGYGSRRLQRTVRGIESAMGV